MVTVLFLLVKLQDQEFLNYKEAILTNFGFLGFQTFGAKIECFQHEKNAFTIKWPIVMAKKIGSSFKILKTSCVPLCTETK